MINARHRSPAKGPLFPQGSGRGEWNDLPAKPWRSPKAPRYAHCSKSSYRIKYCQFNTMCGSSTTGLRRGEAKRGIGGAVARGSNECGVDGREFGSGHGGNFPDRTSIPRGRTG